MSQITFLSHDPFGSLGKTFKTAGVSVQLRSVSFEYWRFLLGFKIEIIDRQERSSAILVLRDSRIIDKKKVKAQGHPTTVFCKISVRRSKYCLKFYITWRGLKISRWPFQSGTIFNAYWPNKFPTIFWGLIFHIWPKPIQKNGQSTRFTDDQALQPK